MNLNRELVQIYKSLIDETSFLLKNQKFPIISYPEETDPNDISLLWKSWKDRNPLEIAKEAQEKLRGSRDLINFSCSLCENKQSGIRNFISRGRIPILVLHYSGAVLPKDKPFIKMNPKQIFKDALTEKIWSSLIQSAYEFTYEELYYQEFPACNFQPTKSNPESWKQRTESCKLHIKETISLHSIQGIIILGSSAKVLYGDGVKEKLGKWEEWQFEDLSIPTMVFRSPEALVALESKSKDASLDQNALFNYAKDRKDIEQNFVSMLKEFKSKLKNIE